MFLGPVPTNRPSASYLRIVESERCGIPAKPPKEAGCAVTPVRRGWKIGWPRDSQQLVGVDFHAPNRRGCPEKIWSKPQVFPRSGPARGFKGGGHESANHGGFPQYSALLRVILGLSAQ